MINVIIKRNTLIVKTQIKGVSTSNNILALDALSSTGLIARTATNTWASRTITGTANQVSVTNGDGVSGNPTLALPQDIHTAARPTFAGATLSESRTSSYTYATIRNTNTSTTTSFLEVKLLVENGGNGITIGVSPTSGSTLANSTYIKPVSDSSKFIFSTSSFTEVLKISFSPRGIAVDKGSGNPTAALHVRGGFDSANLGAPMKIDSGTLLTVPEAGAIENNGTHIYWTSNAGTRYQLDQQGGGGSGTVNTGVAGTLALYPSNGTTVDDAYSQNSQDISIAVAAQASRSAGLTYTFPNPGNAETAAQVVLNKDSSGYVSILHNLALGDQTAAVSGYTPLDYNLQLGDTGTSARNAGITLLGYQSSNNVIGNLVFVNENLAISDKRGIVMEAKRAGSNHIMNFYYNNGTSVVQVGAFGGNGSWSFGNTSIQSSATVYIAAISNLPNLRLAGTTVSSPAAGDLYYNSTKKHVCFGMAISLDACIVGQIYSATADSTAITANSETDFSLTKTLEANGFTAGKNIFIFAGGKLSTDASSAGTLIIKIKLGSTTIATGLTLTLPTSYSNVGWICEGVLTCRTTGASGTVVFDGKIIIDNDLYCAFTSAGTVTIDTTASQVLKLTNTFSVTGNSITMQTLALPTGN